MSAGPSVFGIARRGARGERLGLRASARKEELLHGGIGKFRCETKEGKGGRGSGSGWKDIDDEHEETGRSASGMRLRLR